MPFAVDDDDGDLALTFAERVFARLEMSAERRRNLRQFRVVHPNLVGSTERTAGLDRKPVAFLLLRRHLVIGDLGVAAKGGRLGHLGPPSEVQSRARAQTCV